MHSMRMGKLHVKCMLVLNLKFSASVIRVPTFATSTICTAMKVAATLSISCFMTNRLTNVLKLMKRCVIDRVMYCIYVLITANDILQTTNIVYNWN